MTTAATCPAEAVTALGPLVDALVRQPLQDLPVAVLQERIAAVAPQVARLHGWLGAAGAELQAVTLGQLPTDDGGSRTTVGWLAETTRTSSSAAGSALSTATGLRTMPAVVDAVLDGVLTPEQAAPLARLVGRIDPAELLATQAHLITVARALTPPEVAVWVRHLIATHVEPELEADEQAGQRTRYLQHRREADGSLRGRFVLSAEDSEAFLTVLEPLARRQGGQDDRSAGQRRADALVEVCEQVLRHGELPEAGGQRPHLSYVLPADWAARQASAAQCADCTRCPQHRPASLADTVAAALPGQPGMPAEHACATAAWSGPQTRARIEAILCDARISRVLLDPAGQVTGLETLRDSVTPAQRRVLAARDITCVARGCTRPPAMCDAHHLTRLADGGATTLDNLVLLCRRHHVLWHLGKLRLRHLHVPWLPEPEPPPGPW
jgi:hypothetical protein